MKLNNTLSFLKLLSKKIDSRDIITDEDLDALSEIVFSFRNLRSSEISIYFEGKLNNEECSVFYNFYKNIEDISPILDTLKEKKRPSIEVIKNYFFNGKQVPIASFSDTYRSSLNYIQKYFNIQIKTKIFSDLKIYFDTGCFEEDLLNDHDFRLCINAANSKNKSIFDSILEKSESRNILIEAINNPETGARTVLIENTEKSNLLIPNSRFMDCVKETPFGLVVSIACSDGKISKDQEKEKLEKYLSCIEFGIQKGEFKYSKNEIEKTVISTDAIHEIRFFLLTEFKLQDGLKEFGISNEKYSFLMHCMTRLIRSFHVGEDLKNKVKLDGIACDGIENLKNIDKIIINDIDKIIQNKNKIISLMENGENQRIVDFFNKISQFLIKNATYIKVENFEDLCSSVEDFINNFGNTCLGDLTSLELSEIFIPKELKSRNERYRALISSEQEKLRLN